MTDTTLPDEIKRWTAQRRASLVVQLIRGETTVNEAARQYDLKPSEIQQWYDAFVQAGTNGLKSNPKEELAEKDKKIDQLHKKIGEMTMDIEILQYSNKIMQEDKQAAVNSALFGKGSTSSE